MSDSYQIDTKLSEKFNKIRGDKFGHSITRLEMVKISIENIINTLLKKTPKVKVGLITFGNEVEIKGDYLSNTLIVNKENIYNESDLQTLGKQNTNLVKSEINKSSKQLIKSLREIKDGGPTPLGPAILLGLSLLNEAKIGSRIFVCTDGQSNRGVGNIEEDKEFAIKFYKRVGIIAKKKYCYFINSI